MQMFSSFYNLLKISKIIQINKRNKNNHDLCKAMLNQLKSFMKRKSKYWILRFAWDIILIQLLHIYLYTCLRRYTRHIYNM